MESSSSSTTDLNEEVSSESNDNFFGVKRIIDVKLENGLKYYKVQWVDSWEPEYNLLGCTDLIQEFLDKQGSKKKDPDVMSGKGKKRKEEDSNKVMEQLKKEKEQHAEDDSEILSEKIDRLMNPEPPLSIKVEQELDSLNENITTAESSDTNSQEKVQSSQKKDKQNEKTCKKRTAKLAASLTISQLYDENISSSDDDKDGGNESANMSDPNDDSYEPPMFSDVMGYIPSSPEPPDFEIEGSISPSEKASSSSSTQADVSKKLSDIDPIDYLQKNFPMTIKPLTSTMALPRISNEPQQSTSTIKETPSTLATSQPSTIQDSNISIEQLRAQAVLLSQINKANLDSAASSSTFDRRNMMTPGVLDDECTQRLKASVLYKIPIKYLQSDCIELLLSHVIFYVVKFIKEMYLEPGELKPDMVQELIAKGAIITIKDNYKLEDLQFLETQINDLTQIAVKYLPYDKLMGMLYTYAVKNVNRTIRTRKNFFSL